MNQQTQGRNLMMIGLIVFIGVIGYYVLNAPDRRSTGDKIGDAINEMPNGATKAARQLENRTPGEKLGDAVQDVGDDIKKTTNQQ